MINPTHALSYIVLGTVVLAGAWGCTTMQEPIALSQARTQYRQAQQDPQITVNAPIALREAEQKLPEADIQRLGEERDQLLIQSRTREAQQATAHATQLEQELATLKAQP